MEITPKSLEVEVEAGQSVFFRVNISSTSPIARFIITRIGNNAPDSVMLDSMPGSKNFTLNWGLKTDKNSTKTIQLLFKAIDDVGNEISNQKLVIPSQKNSLVLFPDNIMFTSGSLKFNAFDLNQMTAVTYDSLLYDTMPNMKPDIRELVNSKMSNPEMATHYWYSPSGGKFVRLQSISFENVTKTELMSVFSGGFPMLNYTDSLKTGDIYAFKTSITDPEQMICLLKIESIVSNPGTLAKYVFSVKK
jgi:hypothetical protein